MAKKKRKLVSKTKKQRKKWFVVNAPEIYNNREIGEIPSFEPNKLLGRTLEISYKVLTGNPKDSVNKVVLKISKVQGQTALTEPIRFLVSDNYIQTVSRKAKKKFIVVCKAKTKDEQQVKIKLYVLSRKKIVKSVGSVLIRSAENEVYNFIKKTDYSELFNVKTAPKLNNILRKNLKKIYPVRIYIWKIILV